MKDISENKYNSEIFLQKIYIREVNDRRKERIKYRI